MHTVHGGCVPTGQQLWRTAANSKTEGPEGMQEGKESCPVVACEIVASACVADTVKVMGVLGGGQRSTSFIPHGCDLEWPACERVTGGNIESCCCSASMQDVGQNHEQTLAQ
ncbi:unnamed protein product [Arctogadus glacialis]